MPFSFSIGDGLAIAKLIVDITKSLQDIGGAASDYQELIRELETLQKALTHLDSLQSTTSDSKIYDSIRFAALSCRQPLEEFLRKIRKYEKSLGLWRSGNAVKAAKDKLQWTFGHKDAVDKLQKYLNVHLGTINLMLTEYGLESMAVATDKAAMGNLDIQERLDNTRTLVERLGSSINGQQLMIQSTNSMITRLLNMVSGELRASWQSLVDMVAKVCVSTQLIHGVLLDIRSSVSGIDTRWTFFQAPYVVEDAFGFKFPIPSEYDFAMLNNIIQWRFQDHTSYNEVQAGNYELYKTKNSNEVITIDTFLTPGTYITMGLIVSWSNEDRRNCPMPHCGSSTSLVAPSGSRTCVECGVSFGQSTKPRRSLQDFFSLLDDRDEASVDASVPNLSKERLSRDFNLSSSSEAKCVRHVRCADNNESSSSSHDDLHIADIPLPSTEHELPPIEQISVPESKVAPLLDDAFSYLYEVKAYNSVSPGVYNQFLDIMGDFKTGAIDTPGVIERVCSLFRYSSMLILRFNTFLPPGYHMEVVEQDNSRVVRGTTPMGP